jgi:hypothetical protein
MTSFIKKIVKTPKNALKKNFEINFVKFLNPVFLYVYILIMFLQ